ncbi:MAG: hypothetical protein ABR557_08900 [Pyrinomonadaceae bacterium]
MKFDDEKGELAIIKDGKVVAQASTTTAKRDGKHQSFKCNSPALGLRKS